LGLRRRGVWVSDGCGGEFALGQSTRVAAPATPPAAAVHAAAAPEPAAAEARFRRKVEHAMEERKPTERIESWSVYEPGTGYLIGRTDRGELAISAYAMGRYMNQNDEDQVFTDHLGNERPVDPRNDIFSHRIMVFLKGWMVDPKLVYTLFF
jgi:hypothetical protein